MENLISYPAFLALADIPQESRDARGIGDCLLRLPVGLEPADDLIEDFRQPLTGGNANV